MNNYCQRCGAPHEVGGRCGRPPDDDRITDRITAVVRDSVVDGVRLGIGHAIGIITDYAADTPESRPYCCDLIDQLRRTSTTLAQEARR